MRELFDLPVLLVVFCCGPSFVGWVCGVFGVALVVERSVCQGIFLFWRDFVVGVPLELCQFC